MANTVPTAAEVASDSIAELLQFIWDKSQEVKQLEAHITEAKAALESLYQSGVLEEEWLSDDQRIDCTEFSAVRSVRTNWLYSPAVDQLKANLKDLQDAEKESGIAKAEPGAVIWTFKKPSKAAGG